MGKNEYLHKRALSLKLVSLLNYLNYPFFLLGILFLFWIGIEYFLKFFFSPFVLERVATFSRPVTTVLSPAVVGYWTNRLAIKMLFHPRRRNAVWQGLIPARRSDLVHQIAAAVSEYLISPEIIQKYLRESGLLPEFLNRLYPAVREMLSEKKLANEVKAFLTQQVTRILEDPATEERITAYFKERIKNWSGIGPGKKLLAWTENIWGPVVINTLKKELSVLPASLERFLPYVEVSLEKLPEYIGENREQVEEVFTGFIITGLRSLDLESIIRQQLEKMDEAEIEQLITKTVSAELIFIQTSGGIFGTLVGLAAIFPFLVFVFAGAGLVLLLIYRLTVK
ncbi:MAG TPA: DUF445 family protein [Firmicutes bacterium]|jgi:uncharacterized membrane protein YheB (UPF0754 family)|nr:DUF445 family protein [Bacillota bacterium]